MCSAFHAVLKVLSNALYDFWFFYVFFFYLLFFIYFFGQQIKKTPIYLPLDL